MKKRIVCFGDSNTWGLNAVDHSRYSEEIRWPCLLQENLGSAYQVVEEGLPGRTAVMEDPIFEGVNGLSYIVPCLKSHAPVDMLIIMLGTNDTKERYALTAYNIAQGIEKLAKRAEGLEVWGNNGEPKILVVAPPYIGSKYQETEVVNSMGKNCDLKSKALPIHLEGLLQDTNMKFLDSNKGVSMGDVDYMHLNQEGHRAMASVIYGKLSEAGFVG